MSIKRIKAAVLLLQFVFLTPFVQAEERAPQLVIAIVSRIGTPFSNVRLGMQEELKKAGYVTEQISVKKIITQHAESAFNKNLTLHYRNLYTSVQNLIHKTKDKEVLGKLIVNEIINRKKSYKGTNNLAFIVDVVKNFDDIKFLHKIYGNNLIVIGINTAKNTRLDNLKAKLVENGSTADYDQEVANIKALEATTIASLDNSMAAADFYIHSTKLKPQKQKIQRLLELLFGHPYRSPSMDEQGMMLAHVARFRSVDLGRQVGASIVHNTGSVISIGCNEVPKAHGGMYWNTDNNDSRDFTLGSDLNKRLIDSNINILIEELKKVQLLSKNIVITNQKMSTALKKAGFKDSIEFMRSTHAEMGAIADAAMYGKELKKTTMYTTTFPCHLCTRMIVASGIKRVVFLESYKKSKAAQMYSDSISINSVTNETDKVNFELFEGIAPKRYFDFFKMKKRKNDGNGRIINWSIVSDKSYDMFISNQVVSKNEEIFLKENKSILQKLALLQIAK